MAEAPEQFELAVCDDIRDFALSFPDSSEGSSCVNRAFKAGSKNFVFLGEKAERCTIRLKLDASADDVRARSASDDRYEVCGGGWTKIVFDGQDAPAMDDLRLWITESFLLLAPKKVVAKFD